MISTLRIQGLAIIDSLSIEFDDGFNVITGETGAGKSILIRALHFLTGGRAGTDSVRQGHPQATVSGTFHVPANHPATLKLDLLGLDYERGPIVPIVLRRQVSIKGRSQAWINDAAVSTAALREVGVRLIDVFGQHENQRLLDDVAHTDYVDAFLPDPGVLAEYQVAWSEVTRAVKELNEFVERLASATRNRDFVEYRLRELKEFSPSAEDFQSLEQLCHSFQNATAISQGLGSALRAIEGEEGGSSVSRALIEANKHLGSLKGELAQVIEPVRERLNACVREVEEASFEISQHLSRFDIDESQVDAAQERLFEYQAFFRKHGVLTAEELVDAWTALKEEWKSVESASDAVELLLSTIETKTEALRKCADLLSGARTKASERIRASVEKELQELAMVGSRFSVILENESRPPVLPDLDVIDSAFSQRCEALRCALAPSSARGSEVARFFLSSNPGEPLMPLARIASGGELSRIMLAMKKALAADADTCVLVFDEIDTGISGRVADIVGRKMRDLSARFQVLCISHLPQVAVYADAHFLVHKEGKADRTESGIRRLTDEASAVEIARLLSGSKVSASSLANARTLISKARKRVPYSIRK